VNRERYNKTREKEIRGEKAKLHKITRGKLMDKKISGKETHCYDMDRIGRDRIAEGPL